MKKVLIVATIDQHIRHFHIPFIEELTKNGFIVDIASNGTEKFENVSNKYDISFTRNPLSFNNINSFKQLKEIVYKNNYDLIHCHTPVGGVITRLVKMWLKKNDSKIIYTAHGFHFYKGSSYKNWLLFYNIERILSKWTDVLITINHEDYKIAAKKFYANRTVLIDGVGVDLTRFNPVSNERKKAIRNKNGLHESDIILTYVAELSDRKNQEVLIQAMNIISKSNSNVKLLLVGMGDNEQYYRDLIKKLGLENEVRLLGYRTDINELMGCSDIAVSSSRQEGLPVNIIEAISIGLPVVASSCRGNRDLIIDGYNGYLVSDNDPVEYSEKTIYLINNKEARKKLSNNNLKTKQKYDVKIINRKLLDIYSQM